MKIYKNTKYFNILKTFNVKPGTYNGDTDIAWELFNKISTLVAFRLHDLYGLESVIVKKDRFIFNDMLDEGIDNSYTIMAEKE